MKQNCLKTFYKHSGLDSDLIDCSFLPHSLSPLHVSFFFTQLLIFLQHQQFFVKFRVNQNKNLRSEKHDAQVETFSLSGSAACLWTPTWNRDVQSCSCPLNVAQQKRSRLACFKNGSHSLHEELNGFISFTAELP